MQKTEIFKILFGIYQFTVKYRFVRNLFADKGCTLCKLFLIRKLNFKVVFNFIAVSRQFSFYIWRKPFSLMPKNLFVFIFFFLRFIFKNHRLQHYMRLIRIYLRRVFIDKIPIIS